MDFEKRVKRIRLELELTQIEFANKIGVSQSLICNLENGLFLKKDKKKKELIYAIIKSFPEIKLDFLLEKSNNMLESNYVPQTVFNEEAIENKKTSVVFFNENQEEQIKKIIYEALETFFSNKEKKDMQAHQEYYEFLKNKS